MRGTLREARAHGVSPGASLPAGVGGALLARGAGAEGAIEASRGAGESARVP